MFEKYGTPPKVDDISFDPKIKCNEMSGYHLTATEVECIGRLIGFVTSMKENLRSVDLSKTLQRMENSMPIDDASLLSPGDAIISLGDHTTNPLEDVITLAKIWRVMAWVIGNAEDDFDKLMANGPEYAEQEMLKMANDTERRRAHFARNVKGNMRVGGGLHLYDGNHDPDSCPICRFREENGEEPTTEQAIDIIKNLLGKMKEFGPDAPSDIERKPRQRQEQPKRSSESDMDRQIKDMLNQMEKNIKDNPNDIN